VFEYQVVEIFRSTGSVREDEFCFPPVHDYKSTAETLEELFKLLLATITELEKSNDDPVLDAIATHLKLRLSIIKSTMLMIYGISVLKPQEEEDKKEEETKSKAKNKKKKNKNKKKQKEIDPWEESEKMLTNGVDVLLPKLKEAGSHTSSDDQKLARKLFDPTIMRSINMVVTLSNNNVDMTFEQALDYFTQLCIQMNEAKNIRTLKYVYQISSFVKKLHSRNPAPLIRCVTEKILFPHLGSIEVFGLFEMSTEYLRGYVTSLFPSIWTHYDCKQFKDFMHKFSLMTRETLLKQLKNIANQPKSLQRYYEGKQCINDLALRPVHPNF